MRDNSQISWILLAFNFLYKKSRINWYDYLIFVSYADPYSTVSFISYACAICVAENSARPVINLSADWQMIEARDTQSIRKSVRVRQLDAR